MDKIDLGSPPLLFEEDEGVINVEGYLFRYSDPKDTKDRDLHKQWWSKKTYLMQETYPIVDIPIMFSHSVEEDFSRIGIGVVTMAQEDDIGVFIKGQLHNRKKWEKIVEEVSRRRGMNLTQKQIEEFARIGYENIKSVVLSVPLNWSMGSYPPTYQANKKTGEIESAGIVEATLTPSPAEPVGTEVSVHFKSLLNLFDFKELDAKESSENEEGFEGYKNSNESFEGGFQKMEAEEKAPQSEDKVKGFLKRMTSEFMAMMNEEYDKMMSEGEEEAKMTEPEKEEMKSVFMESFQEILAKDTGFTKAMNEEGADLGTVAQEVYNANIQDLVRLAVDSHMTARKNNLEKSRKAIAEGLNAWKDENPVGNAKSAGLGGFSSPPIDPASIKDYEGAGIGDFFRDLYLGKTPNANYTKSIRETDGYQKAQSPYIGPLGGFLQGETMSQSILEPLRPEVVMFDMGVKQTTINNVGIYTVPKMTTAPQAYRPGINDQITEDEAEYETITAMVRPLAARVVVPRQQLLTTGTNMETQLREQIIKSLRLQIDKEILTGIGNVEGTGNTGAGIKGIKQHVLQSGLTAHAPTLATNGARPKYSDLIDAETQIASANVELEGSTSGWVMHPRDRGTFRRTFDSTGNPLLYPNFSGRPYEDMIGYKVRTTTQLPTDITTGTNNATSDIFFGNYGFSEYIMAQDIEVIYDDTTRADQLQVRFIVYLYSDFIVHYPEAFYIMQGVSA